MSSPRAGRGLADPRAAASWATQRRDPQAGALRFDGSVVALARKSGRIAWREKLPALTNAPIAVQDDTLITAASFPGGKGQTTEDIAYRLGAHGPLIPPAPRDGGGGGGAADGAAVFSQNCSSCYTLVAAKAKGTVGPNLGRPEAHRGGGAATGHQRRRRHAGVRRPADQAPDRRRREVRRERRRNQVAGGRAVTWQSAVRHLTALQLVAAPLLCEAVVEPSVHVGHVAVGEQLDDLPVDQVDLVLDGVEPLTVEHHEPLSLSSAASRSGVACACRMRVPSVGSVLVSAPNDEGAAPALSI
jgi:hypothetical protein